MKSNKLHFLIIALFVLFWLGLIAWSMFKTTNKLTSKKPIIVETPSPLQKESKAAKTEPAKKEETPAPKPTKEKIPPPSRAILDQLKQRLGLTSDKKEKPTLAPVESTTPSESSPILVRTFIVAAKDFHDQLPVMGTIKAKAEIPLKFEINGVIKKIYFRESEKIKKGEIIMELDPKDMQYKLNYTKNKFNATQAAYNSSQKKVEVYQKLYEAGAIIKSKLEEVQLDCESARYQVETARSEMELAENEFHKVALYAGKDGIMGKREAEEGEFVTPQDKAASFYVISEVNVEVGIVERDIDKIKLGEKAKVYVDAYPSTAFEGIVDSIYPTVEGKSRTLTAKIKVNNSEGMLMPGMFSRAEILIIELKNAFIVPTTCIINAGRDINLIPIIPPQTIKKTEEETEVGIVQLRQVKVGYATSDYAQVEQGLDAGDLVVLEAQGELKDKSKVKIIGKEELDF